MSGTNSMVNDFIRFAENNPIYLVCSIIYYIIGSCMLGGTIFSFFIVLVFYIISLTVVFSPVGEKILRLLERVRRLETNREKEYLIPLFEEVYEEAKRNYPRLGYIEICVIDQMYVNACALGRSTIAVTKGAIETFSEDELKAILSHEIAHIINTDTIATLYTIVGNGIFTILILINKFFIFLLDILQEIFDKSGFARAIIGFIRFIFEAFIFVFMFLMQIAMAINSRSNEYRADMYTY